MQKERERIMRPLKPLEIGLNLISRWCLRTVPMKRKTVKEIILPVKKGLPRHPSVTMNHRIMDAVELMVKHNLKNITVVLNGRPIGRVRLEDALKELGIQVPGT